MDFPAWPPAATEAPPGIEEALGAPVEWTGLSDNRIFRLALVADERSVRGLSPDLTAVSQLDASALIVTAVADQDQRFDFVSRLFAPTLGIPEDPVTGSAHTVLAPFWASRLGRTSLVGLQASPRSGLVGVELDGDRVTVVGRAITVVDGVLSSAAGPRSSSLNA
jgi:predicted PhzF superfamily epimerase YddE/YHI9